MYNVYFHIRCFFFHCIRICLTCRGFRLRRLNATDINQERLERNIERQIALVKKSVGGG